MSEGIHPGFSDAQNNEPANWDSQDWAIGEGQIQYLGVQQPSEIKVPGFCPSQRMAQSGSGYSVEAVEVEVVVGVEVWEVVMLVDIVEIVVVDEEAVVDIVVVVEDVVDFVVVVEVVGVSGLQQKSPRL